MIQLKKLFTPVASMDAAEARAYIASHPEGAFTILDVRQPWEYEKAHIPGAKLVPLPRLADAYQELDPEKPTIVHCAIGGRSRVAAQMLSGLGFKEVYNLAGGINAYQGQTATGPQELNLDLVRGDETPEAIIILAYGMEKGLKGFYETQAAKTPDPELKGLLLNLAQIEEQHQRRLFDFYAASTPEDLATFEAATVPQILEGGFDIQEFMAKNESYLQRVPQVLDLAMMLETQALDLYLRFAEKSAHAAAREVLLRLATEEKAHLARLGRLLEEKLGKGR